MSFTKKDCMYRLHRNTRCPLPSLPHGVESTISFACICLDNIDFEIMVFAACCADFICWWIHRPVTEARFFHTLGQNYIYTIQSNSSKPLTVPGTASTGFGCLCSRLVLDVGKPNFKWIFVVPKVDRTKNKTTSPTVVGNPHERTVVRRPSLLRLYHFERRNKAPCHLRTAKQPYVVTH
jgi:hypothetical protein